MRALRDRPTALERWPKGVREGIGCAPGDGRRGRRVLLEAPPQGAPDYVETGERDVPVGPHRRRGLPDRARGPGVGRADGHADLPPVAGAARPTRPPRRAAHRPRPARRTDFPTPSGSPAAPASCSTELGLVGFPKTSGNRGVHVYVRIEPRWDFVDVRHAAIGVRARARAPRTAGVTTSWWKEERGEQHLRRLQPELPRPHHRLAPTACGPSPGAPVSTPMDVGRARRGRGPGRLQPVHGAGAVRRAGRRARRDRRRAPTTCSRCSTCTTSRSPPARAS